MLKDCLMQPSLQVEMVKKAEYYDLLRALQKWQTMPCISIHEVLTAKVANAGKMIDSDTVSATNQTQNMC